MKGKNNEKPFMGQEKRGNNKQEGQKGSFYEQDKKPQPIELTGSRMAPDAEFEPEVAVPFSDHEAFPEDANQRAVGIMEVVTERSLGQSDDIYAKIDEILDSNLTTDSRAMYKVTNALNN